MLKYRIGIYILLCFTDALAISTTKKPGAESSTKPQTIGNTSTEPSTSPTTTTITTTESPVAPECIATDETGAILTNKFWNCTVLMGNGSMVEIMINHWQSDSLKKFADNAIHLENIKMKLAERNLEGFSFQRLTSIKNSSLNIYNNTNVKFDIFPKLNKSENLNLKIRGNMRIIDDGKLYNICNETNSCDIQIQDECVFWKPIDRKSEYENCPAVYGDMQFGTKFEGYLPRGMKFILHGCFKLIGSNLRILAYLSEVRTTCSTKHEIKNNNLLCKEDRVMTIKSFKEENVDFEVGNSEAECAKAECFGYGILEAETKYFLGCEFVKSQLQIDGNSGDLKEHIRDLAFIRTIEGQFVVENNASIEKLSLPLLKNIHAKKCPALIIRNMPNLRSVLFHPYFTVTCGEPTDKTNAILIQNCPKLELRRSEVYRWDKYQRIDYTEMQFESRGPFFYIQFGIYAAIGTLIMIEIYVFTFNRGQERSEELEELLEFTKE